MMRIVVVTLVALTLSGCGAALVDSRSISYVTPDHEETGEKTGQTKSQRLFIWKSGYSAGIGTENGICVQGALTATANNLEANGKIGSSALAAINPALTPKQNDELASAGIKQGQAVMLVNSTNGQTAFANISLFYLCQISLNRSLNDHTIAAMWSETNRTIATVAAMNAGASSIDAGISKAPGPNAPLPTPTATPSP